MDEEAFQRIEARLDGWLIRMGHAELSVGTERFDVEDGAKPWRGSRGRILRKLEALERLLSIHDRATYEKSMYLLTSVLERGAGSVEGSTNLPKAAVLLDNSPDRSQAYFLAELPTLALYRERLRALHVRIAEMQ